MAKVTRIVMVQCPVMSGAHYKTDDNLEEELDTDGSDEEDGPDWAFEADEKRSKDPEYEFCPAAHRKQLLSIVTRHFCQHPFFPACNGSSQTAAQICEESPQIIDVDQDVDSPSPTSSEVNYESDDEEMISKNEEISKLIGSLERAADILKKQSALGSSKWKKAITSTPLFSGALPLLDDYIQAVHLHKARPERTWPKSPQEKQWSQYVVDNYLEHYPEGVWTDPAAYVKSSDMVEECVDGAILSGFTYDMDEHNVEWLRKNNNIALGEGQVAQFPRQLAMSKLGARTLLQTDSLVFTEDEIELVMGLFEKFTNEKCHFLHLDIKVPPCAQDPSHLIRLARTIYPYYKEREIVSQGHKIIPSLNFNKSNAQDAYVSRLWQELIKAKDLANLMVLHEVKLELNKDTCSVLEARIRCIPSHLSRLRSPSLLGYRWTKHHTRPLPAPLNSALHCTCLPSCSNETCPTALSTTLASPPQSSPTLWHMLFTALAALPTPTKPSQASHGTRLQRSPSNGALIPSPELANFVAYTLHCTCLSSCSNEDLSMALFAALASFKNFKQMS
ncbi:uncharacterized protein EI90DRAFT_3019545 [Cantharellus anzutake]|uniref:uncharacterized protein n=1 Tax=Cantharellus anzutake TaxID=1750568 RepID=UPI0019043387|nr:uncharacterized protein EI90DRAFT_3019545 [Cantharellus anzutake]KAF8324407.1 hypothetical protein EI90DRAFT_3019545 [Cantharellus anzutake]